MLIFMNLKLTKMTGKDKQSHIFQKNKPYEMSSTEYIYIYIYIYIYMYNIYIHIYTGKDWEYICIPLDREIYTKCKKTPNLIKGISSHNVCPRIKIQQVKKNICRSVPKTFDFSQNFSVSFHQVTFDHSISCVLLIDKPNGSCQNSEKFERNTSF